jgi:hypothetical protein
VDDSDQGDSALALALELELELRTPNEELPAGGPTERK